jgi:hypothetical protein
MTSQEAQAAMARRKEVGKIVAASVLSTATALSVTALAGPVAGAAAGSAVRIGTAAIAKNAELRRRQVGRAAVTATLGSGVLLATHATVDYQKNTVPKLEAITRRANEIRREALAVGPTKTYDSSFGPKGIQINAHNKDGTYDVTMPNGQRVNVTKDILESGLQAKSHVGDLQTKVIETVGPGKISEIHKDPEAYGKLIAEFIKAGQPVPTD